MSTILVSWNTLTPEQRNALVAEKVMGWKPGICDGSMGEQPCSPDGWFCQKCGEEGYWGDDFEHEEIAPRYTQSMDLAWKIVEHFAVSLIVLERMFFKTTDTYGDNVLLWQCRFQHDREHNGKWYSSVAKEPAEALCLAFLLYVEDTNDVKS